MSPRLDLLFAAVRSLRRRPGFASLSICLLTLGIGSLVAIFAIVNATMLRPLPYESPDRLFAAVGTEPAGRDSATNMPLGWYQFIKWRSENRMFDAIEAYTPVTMKLLGNGEPEPLTGFLVSAGFFDVLGWRPMLGTTFTRDQEVAASPAIVISHGLWVRRFSSDPGIIGRVVNVDDMPRSIVGVMPRGFSMLFQSADAWLPITLDPPIVGRKARLLIGVARLKENASLAQGQADLASINRTLALDRPDEHRNTGVRITPMREFLFGNQDKTLLVLFGAGVLLWTVALVNLLSLTLGDAISRRPATMTRLAFGARPTDITRARIAETFVLAAVACIVSLGLVTATLPFLYEVAPALLASIREGAVDGPVIGVAILLAIIATVAAGVPTAVSESRVSLSGIAGSDLKAVGGRTERRNRALLLATQVALAVVLLIGASLLGRNLQSLFARPLGFATDDVTVVELTFSRTRYVTVADRAQYAERLTDAIRAIPGVEAVATIQTRFVANETMQTLFEIDGKPMPPGSQSFVNIRHVTPEVGRVLRLRLQRGRMFTSTDRAGSVPVAIVSRSFARQYWGEENPVGSRIRRVSSMEAPWMQVVGVVDDIRDSGVGTEPGPALFVSYLQQNTPTARPTLVIRSRSQPGQLFPAVRRAIWSVDPTQTIDAMSRLDELMLRTASQPRFAAIVGGLLAGSALVLVLAGIYAVTLHGVLRRTREIGVRTALGATSEGLIWTMMRQGLAPAIGGIAIGVVTAIPATGAMTGILADGLSVADAPIIALVVLLIIMATAVAAFIPARRALRVSPMVAMRDAQ